MIYAIDLFNKHRGGKVAKLKEEYFIYTAFGPVKILQIEQQDSGLWAKVMTIRDQVKKIYLHGWYKVLEGLQDNSQVKQHTFKRRF